MLTISEFAEAAARAVQASGAVPDNRQAKAVPAARMIRYYTARGLLPRPGTRGRSSLYLGRPSDPLDRGGAPAGTPRPRPDRGARQAP